jgi:hypothetical protein
MVDDRLEVAIGEPSGLGREPKRSIDLSRADECGELGRPADLGPDPLGTGRRGEDEPAFGTVAEIEEGRLGGAGRSWPRMERIGGALRIVSGIDARVAGRRQPVPGHFAGAHETDMGHDELVPRDSNPDALAGEPVRHRVAGRAKGGSSPRRTGATSQVPGSRAERPVGARRRTPSSP